MLGEQLLSVARTAGEAKEIHSKLGLNVSVLDDNLFKNANKLVEMNNELYDKHKNITWLQERINIITNL